MVGRLESAISAVVATRTDSFTAPPACTSALICAGPVVELRLTFRLPPALMVVETARLGAVSRTSPSPVETGPLSVSLSVASNTRSLTVRMAEPRIVRLPGETCPARIEIGALLAPTASTVRASVSSTLTV